MPCIDSDNMGNQSVEPGEKAVGQGPHHNQPGEAGVDHTVKDLRVFQLQLGLDQGNASAQAAEFLFYTAEDGQVIGIAVFSAGSGEQASDRKTRVRVRPGMNLPAGQRLVTQFRDGTENLLPGFVRGFINLVVIQNPGNRCGGYFCQTGDVTNICHGVFSFLPGETIVLKHVSLSVH